MKKTNNGWIFSAKETATLYGSVDVEGARRAADRAEKRAEVKAASAWVTCSHCDSPVLASKTTVAIVCPECLKKGKSLKEGKGETA
jgi:Zn finger protein HypA/HybF involved in hydrogenase expression